MIKHPFVKQRSEAPPVTVAVTAWRRGTGRPERVSGIRVLSVTPALLIIHVGRDATAGDEALNSSRLLNVSPCCRFVNVTLSPRAGIYTRDPLVHLKETFGTRVLVRVRWKAERRRLHGSPSICNLKMPEQKCAASKSS